MRVIRDNDASNAPELLPAGWRTVRVKSCTEKTSQRHEAYYNLELVDAETGQHAAWEVCMIEGRGVKFGLPKLALFGAAQRDEAAGTWQVLEPREVEGRTARVYLVHKTEEWNGESRTKCEISITRSLSRFDHSTDAPEPSEQTADSTRAPEPDEGVEV